MGEEFVLAFQLGHVRVSFRFLVKEASLPEKQGFKSCQGVTVFPKEMQGEGFRESLHRLGIGAESKCPRKHHIGGLFPVAVIFIDEGPYAVGFGMEPFIGERCKPVEDMEGWD